VFPALFSRDPSLEQIVFVLAHFRQAIGKGRVDMHMAGGARAAAAAQPAANYW
jgi:hypothetical protein